VAFLSPEDILKTKWQIRHRDRSRSPEETTDSVWKAECALPDTEGYTHEAERRGYLAPATL